MIYVCEMKQQLTVQLCILIQCETLSVGWRGKKNVTENFRFMLFTVSFRLMFCNAVYKEGGCDKKRSVKYQCEIIFLSNQVSD